jgi:hypothetical protein
MHIRHRNDWFQNNQCGFQTEFYEKKAYINVVYIGIRQ